MSTKTQLHPHPGETILEDFMEPLGLTAYRTAKLLGIQQTALAEILAGRRGISAEMAFRLERLTGAEAQFWLNLQSGYEISLLRHDKAFSKKIEALSRLEMAA